MEAEPFMASPLNYLGRTSFGRFMMAKARLQTPARPPPHNLCLIFASNNLSKLVNVFLDDGNAMP